MNYYKETNEKGIEIELFNCEIPDICQVPVIETLLIHIQGGNKNLELLRKIFIYNSDQKVGLLEYNINNDDEKDNEKDNENIINENLVHPKQENLVNSKRECHSCIERTTTVYATSDSTSIDYSQQITTTTAASSTVTKGDKKSTRIVEKSSSKSNLQYSSPVLYVSNKEEIECPKILETSELLKNMGFEDDFVVRKKAIKHKGDLDRKLNSLVNLYEKKNFLVL